MTKLEIYIPNDSRFAPSVVERDFILSTDGERHVYKGKQFTIDEFNEIANTILLNKKYYKRPTVRAIEVIDNLTLSDRTTERPKVSRVKQTKVSEEVEI